MTRDSQLWTFLRIITALLTAIAGFALASDHGAASLGLSTVALNWILVVNSAVALIGGSLGNSPLPGKNDSETINGSGKFIGMLLMVALAGATLIGCAGNLRVTLIKAHQGIETTLATIDDAERVMCFGTATLAQVPDPTRCTTALAVQAHLTDAKHQQFHRLLARAYADQERLGPVLQSWTGPGLPADLEDVLRLADQITALAREFNAATPDVGNLIQTILRWQSELASIKSALGGGVQ